MLPMKETSSTTKNVIICDDDPLSRAALRDCLQEYAQMQAIDIAIQEYENAEAFLDNHESFDVLFLDIYMADMDGTEAAWQLSIDERKRTVFLTTSEDHAIEAYRLNAAHYMLKPVSLNSVIEAFDRCAPEGNKAVKRVLTVRTTDGVTHIPTDSILMVEAQDKVCAIYTENGHWRAYMSLSVFEEQLDKKYFIRIHRSYIVNMKHIKSLYHDRLVMDNGDTISLSRNRRQEVKRRYQDFMFALARGELS